MQPNSTSTLVDLCVLAGIAEKDDYADTLFEKIRSVVNIDREDLDLSLQRLAAQGFLVSYEWPADGASRAFYRLTDLGYCLLEQHTNEWIKYLQRVDDFLRPAQEATLARKHRLLEKTVL